MSTVETSTVNPNNEALVEVLSDAKVQAALVTALEKLPAMMEQYNELEKTIEFVRNFVKDTDSVQYMLGALKADLPDVNMNRDTLNATLTLVDKLPKLVETINAIEPMAEFVQAVLNDRQSLENLVRGAEDLVKPAKDTLQEGLSIVAEAKRRAADDRTPVGIFSLLKLLKDPTVQYGIHFAQAMVAVLGERKVK